MKKVTDPAGQTSKDPTGSLSLFYTIRSVCGFLKVYCFRDLLRSRIIYLDPKENPEAYTDKNRSV